MFAFNLKSGEGHAFLLLDENWVLDTNRPIAQLTIYALALTGAGARPAAVRIKCA